MAVQHLFGPIQALLTTLLVTYFQRSDPSLLQS